MRHFTLQATQAGWEVLEQQTQPSGVYLEHCTGSGVFSPFLQPLAAPGVPGCKTLLQVAQAGFQPGLFSN